MNINIDLLIKVLDDNLNICELKDKEKILNACKLLKNLKTEILTLDELEKLHLIITDLEVKYEVFFEIGNYFDNIYISAKKDIHQIEVKKIKEKNRLKRRGK